MGVVCALALTAVAEWVKPKRLQNEKAERYLNVLAVFDIPVAADAGNEDIIRTFEEHVKVVGSDPDKPDYYLYGKMIALPAEGPGLWAPIHGLIGLEADRRTIQAVSFYKQEETPGLGGEIATRAFTDRFMGKRLFDDSGQPAIRLVAGGNAEGPYQVDAISGATMTSDGVQALMNKAGEAFIRLKEQGR